MTVSAVGVAAVGLAALVVGAVVVLVARSSVRRQSDADTESCLTNLSRLHAVEDSGLLDRRPRPELDELTHQAAERLEAPVAVMSLVGADRQFFASQYGLDEELAQARETPLDYSYCKHVVARGGPLVVPDAEHHEVVRDAFAATGGARAYLGVPLRSPDGHVLGSFCVVDHRPRDWDTSDQAALEELADTALAVSGVR